MDTLRYMLSATTKKFIVLFVVMFSVFCQAFSVHAQGGGRPYKPQMMLIASQGARITMGDAMSMVQQRTGGRVVSAQNIKQDGQEAYRIKVLTRSGEIKIFVVDAQSGSVRQD